MALTRTQINTLISTATSGEFTELGQVLNIAEQNEKLMNVGNKLIKMINVITFEEEFLTKFSNVFETGNEKIDIGALIQIIGLGLISVVDDTIASATDLLPDLTAIPLQYVKTMITDFKKRVELVVNNNIFARAFTSIGAFNSFLTNYIGRLNKSMVKAIYDYAYSDIMKNIKNIDDTRGGNTPVTQTLKTVFINVYSHCAEMVPYSKKFNLGAVRGATTITQGTDNRSGLDFSLATKDNTTPMEVVDGVTKFNTLNILLKGELYQKYNSLVLSTQFNNQYLALEKKFANVLIIPDEYVEDTDAATTQSIVVIAKDGYLIASNIETIQQQLWAKGTGGGIIQYVMFRYMAFGLIAFANGFKYLFTETAE